METTTNFQNSSEVMMENYPIFIFISFLRDGEVTRRTMFMSETEILAEILEYCKSQEDDDLKYEAFDVLVDEDGEYDIIFSEKLRANPSLIFDPQISEAYMEFGNALMHYLCFFSELPSLLERPEADGVVITVAINLNDLSRTQIVGSVTKKGEPDEVIPFHIN